MATADGSFHYSVEVGSRFAAFLDDTVIDEDPSIFLSKLKESRAEHKREKKHAKEHKPASKVEHEAESEVADSVAAEVNQALPEQDEEAPRYSPRGRGQRGRTPFRGFYRGPRVPRGSYRPPQASSPEELTQQPVGDAPRVYIPRGRGYGQRYPRFRGGQRMSAQREPADNLNECVETQPEAVPVPLSDDGDKPVPNTEDEHKPEEPTVYTLEEYKAMREASKAPIELSTKAARLANDGRDVFANMVPREKVLINETNEDAHSNVKSAEIIDYCPIDVTFGDRFGRGRPLNRARGYRGGRGARGQLRGARGGRFPDAVPVNLPPPPLIHDDHEFPSLSK